MTNVSENKRKELVEQAQDPEQKTPSVRDVKQIAKEEKAKTGDARVQEQLDKKKEPKKEPTLSMEEVAQRDIDMNIAERIAIFNGNSPENRTEMDAFILLGLPCFFDGRPNVDTIIMLVGAMREAYQTTEFDEAYDLIKEWMK